MQRILQRLWPEEENRRDIEKDFRREEVLERIPNQRIACALAAIFIAAGSFIDHVVYPEGGLWKVLIFLRGECACTLLLLYVLLNTAWGKKHHVLVGHIAETTLVFNILAMISLTGARDSPYYAGLSIVMVGVSLLMRWSFFHGLFNVILACGGYSLVLLFAQDEFAPNGTGVSDRYFIASCFFLYVTGFFSAVGTYFLHDLRRNEFRLRDELNNERARLEESHRQLKELDRSKTEFFANISHELRTPLTLILGPLDTLKRFGPARENREIFQLIQSMDENGLRLLRLINELLDLVRLDSGEESLRASQIDAKELLESLDRSFYPAALSKNLDFKTVMEGPIEEGFVTDYNKLEKIITNLAVNAIKFTPHGGKVRISMNLTPKRELRFVVSDTGEGMDQTSQENLFRRFWQVDASAKRKHQGAGIGLSLVYNLVTLLEGTITVDSELGKGSTFVVVIPPLSESALAIEDSATGRNEEEDFLESLNQRASLQGGLSMDYDEMIENPSTAPLADDDAKPIVLVAEDEPDVRRLMISQLKEYQVISAKNGEVAEALAIKHLPDLILLDWMMPGKDGLEICKALRATAALRRVPIIIVTARIDEGSKIAALEAGASDFLNKPFVPTELQLRVRNLLDAGMYARTAVQKSEQLGVALTDLKESESMLVQAEKLSSLGEMSAGIIHEINNPLNYAKTNLYSLRTFSKLLEDEEDRAEFAEVLVDVEEGLERVVQIVQDLRGFAVRDKAQFTNVPLSTVLSTSSRLLGNRMSSINYSVDVEDHIHIEGNANQLCQVFVNFLSNALDALAEVGRENEEGFIKVRAEECYDFVSLHFEDNGCGISEEAQKKIFDPFYSSKAIGDGMGLGLSICYRILNQHGVKVAVESTVGSGTHFTLHFPSLKAQELPTPQLDLATSA